MFFNRECLSIRDTNSGTDHSRDFESTSLHEIIKACSMPIHETVNSVIIVPSLKFIFASFAKLTLD